MGRPTGSKANRSLTLQFGDAVTRSTGHSRDVIPRCGPLSIFSALAQCCPSAVRIDDCGPRDGISELESNKLLEKNGFKRVRDRRAVAKNKNDDPLGAGLYLFSERQWRDATDPAELSYMMEAWKQICLIHPSFARECPFDMLIDVVRTCDEDWRPKGTQWKRKRNRPGEKFSQVLTKNLDGTEDQGGSKRQRTDGGESGDSDTASDDDELSEDEVPSSKKGFADALRSSSKEVKVKSEPGTTKGMPMVAFADALKAGRDMAPGELPMVHLHTKDAAEASSRPPLHFADGKPSAAQCLAQNLRPGGACEDESNTELLRGSDRARDGSGDIVNFMDLMKANAEAPSAALGASAPVLAAAAAGLVGLGGAGLGGAGLGALSGAGAVRGLDAVTLASLQSSGMLGASLGLGALPASLTAQAQAQQALHMQMVLAGQAGGLSALKGAAPSVGMVAPQLLSPTALSLGAAGGAQVLSNGMVLCNPMMLPLDASAVQALQGLQALSAAPAASPISVVRPVSRYGGTQG